MYNEYLVTIVANVKVIAKKVYNFDTLKIEHTIYHHTSLNPVAKKVTREN